MVSRDSLREMLLGRYGVRPEVEGLVGRLAEVALREALRRGWDVVVDETNVTRSARRRWLRLVRSVDVGAKVVCVHFTETRRNLELRMRSPKGLPRREWEEVIARMRRMFEVPQRDEGFDALVKVRLPRSVMDGGGGCSLS